MSDAIAHLAAAARLSGLTPATRARRDADPVAFVFDSEWPSWVDYDVWDGCHAEIVDGRLVARLDLSDGTAVELDEPIDLPADPEAAADLVLSRLREFHDRALAS